MPIVGTATQQPADRRDYDVGFDQWFPPGDYIVASTIAVLPTGPTVTRVFPALGRVVKVWFNGGTTGITYKVTLSATTNDGRIKEVELKIKVKED